MNVLQLDAQATVRKCPIIVLQIATFQGRGAADDAHRECSSRVAPVEIRPPPWTDGR